MAEERDPAPTGVPATSGSLDRDSLEERIAKLEYALAALQQQIAATASPQGIASAPPAAAPPPPPPRPPAQPIPESVHPPASAALAPDAKPAARAAPPPRFTSAAHVEGSSVSFESRLGSQIFNRIAIVLLLIGTAYGLKLAVDRGWIGPLPRILIGLIAGAALVLWSERFRGKGFAAFSYSLKAVGSGVLYLSLWAAFQLYHLLPASAALILMIGVTAWNAFMAWVQDSELLAVYALAGGFATPILLSTGGNHEIFLFAYLLAIDLATIALVRLRGWPRLLLGAFPLTVVYFAGWYLQFWAADELAITSAFIALFGFAFASVPLGPHAADTAIVATRSLRRSTLLEDILQPICAAVFLSLALYSVLQDSGHHSLLPWLMVALAAVYLAIMRAPQTPTASAIHLSLAVVFLTIAIPLKASGHWITVGWLVEGLALMWVAVRLASSGSSADAGSEHASLVLRPLASASLALGFCGIVIHVFGLLESPTFNVFNHGTGTALTGIAVFAATAWLTLRADHDQQGQWHSIAVGSVLLIDFTAAILTLRELGFSWQWETTHPAFRSAAFLTALLGLAILAGVIAASLYLARSHAGDPFWLGCAAYTTIAFNLIAVLIGVREVSAAFAPPPGAWNQDAALQQALAISAWLMLYGALLLTAGFSRRSSFLRWQALVLLLFTILKTFLYDMRNLSQGYRVVSFLALGALLMAISFAYQKDWLNLRGPAPEAPAPSPRPAGPPSAESRPGGAAE
ncbi:MAG TPA: DUF2339 domain-containing protein [Acidobacteriaceae bacterium]|nr:DUF2339 domain-containing protein [Acidobacteriaceae bacterium]